MFADFNISTVKFHSASYNLRGEFLYLQVAYISLKFPARSPNGDCRPVLYGNAA
jgi:hypothetical protein